MFRRFLTFITSRFFLLALLLSSQLAIIVVLCVGIVSSEYGFYYLIAAWVLNIPVLIFIINSKANDTYKITWMLLVACIPVAGIIFYLLFANKRDNKRQRRKIGSYNKLINKYTPKTNDLEQIKNTDIDAYQYANVIVNKNHLYPYLGNKTKYFKFGQEAWPFMLEDLKNAQKYIFLEYFIIENGQFWDSILEILKQKVKSGIEVRVLYDDFGCMSKVPYSFNKQLEKCAIKCKVFNRYLPFIDVKMNCRDHRKILIIDGKISYTGGINLADEYVNLKTRFGIWRDNCIRVEGPATYGFLQLFLTNWDLVNKIEEDFTKFKYDFKKLNNQDSYVLPYGDVPFDYESISEHTYLNIINGAKKYLYISTPYLILTESLQHSLINAKRKGVDVRIVIPGIPDKKITYQLTKSNCYNLILAGIDIYIYTPGFNHAKTFLADDKFATVGTINLDLRSMFLHYENNILLFNNECIKDIKLDFEDMFKNSKLYNKDQILKIGIFKKIWWALLKCFSAMF